MFDIEIEGARPQAGGGAAQAGRRQAPRQHGDRELSDRGEMSTCAAASLVVGAGRRPCRPARGRRGDDRRSAPAGERRSRATWTEVQMAVPARPVGHRPRVPVPRRRLRRRDQSLPARQGRLLQLHDRRVGRRRARPRRRPRAAQRQIRRPRPTGRPITVALDEAGAAGRYQVDDAHTRRRARALAIAFNDKCDVVGRDRGGRSRRGWRSAERVALDFLNGDLVLRWAERELGL